MISYIYVEATKKQSHGDIRKLCVGAEGRRKGSCYERGQSFTYIGRMSFSAVLLGDHS